MPKENLMYNENEYQTKKRELLAAIAKTIQESIERWPDLEVVVVTCTNDGEYVGVSASVSTERAEEILRCAHTASGHVDHAELLDTVAAKSVEDEAIESHHARFLNLEEIANFYRVVALLGAAHVQESLDLPRLTIDMLLNKVPVSSTLIEKFRAGMITLVGVLTPVQLPPARDNNLER